LATDFADFTDFNTVLSEKFIVLTFLDADFADYADFALLQAFLTPFASIGTNLPANSFAAPVCILRLLFLWNLHQS